MNSPQDKNQKNSTEVPPKRSAPKVPAPVDYEYWKKMSIWTIQEALLLLFAIDPAQIDPDKPERRQLERALSDAIDRKVDSNNTEQFQHECREIFKISELIKRALDFGELEVHPNFEFDPFDPYYEEKDLPINPEVFIKWALKKDLDVPGELRELYQPSKPTPNNLPDTVVEQSHIITSPNDFIRNVVLHSDSDEEISFQYGRKKCKFRLDSLGNKQKEVLKEILSHPKYIFSVGPSSGKHEYNRRVQRIRSLSNKIVAFFNKEFGANIPSNHFIFELSPEEGPGKYKPIFQNAKSVAHEKIIAKLRGKETSQLWTDLKKALKNPSKYDAYNIKFITVVLEERGVKKEEIEKFIKSQMPDPQVIKGEFNKLPRADFGERSQYKHP